jgi:hypothetical protein
MEPIDILLVILIIYLLFCVKSSYESFEGLAVDNIKSSKTCSALLPVNLSPLR